MGGLRLEAELQGTLFGSESVLPEPDLPETTFAEHAEKDECAVGRDASPAELHGLRVHEITSVAGDRAGAMVHQLRVK